MTSAFHLSLRRNIEQISKYELIDLRVARALGLKVSQALLLRADEVIR